MSMDRFATGRLKSGAVLPLSEEEGCPQAIAAMPRSRVKATAPTHFAVTGCRTVCVCDGN